jgi:tRNA modification GTPase
MCGHSVRGVNMESHPVVFALSTGAGGAIAIIRMTGNGCQNLASKLFLGARKQNLSCFEPGKMHYGFFCDPESQEIIDEIYLVYFKAEKSYTREDLIELHCHGSAAIIHRVSELLSKSGALPAPPGEFTKRAFLSGRLSLTQAEAVRELVEAESFMESSVAINNLTGGLRDKVMELREDVIDCAAHLEAILDYPEEELESLCPQKLMHRIEAILGYVSDLVASYDRFCISKIGIQVVLLGEPNVGKSSFLNAILKQSRAIVTDIAGTTRDHIEESLTYKGIKFRFVDTAGLRTTSHIIEQLGIEKTLELEREAQICVYLYDGSQPVSLRASPKDQIHLLNKSDLGTHQKNKALIQLENVLEISALKDQGMDSFLDWIHGFALERLKPKQSSEIPTLTSERQSQALIAVQANLKTFIDSLKRGIPMDIALVDLYEAIDHLGAITGKIITEDIIDRIFEKFCIGK